MTRQPYPDRLPDLSQLVPAPTTLHMHLVGILTLWAFRRVQEHPNRSSDEEVMTFRSWRSHMTRQPYPDSLPDLPECPFLASSSTHCPPQEFGWNRDSMGFPYSPITLKTEFGRRSYDLPKFEVTHD